MLISLFWGLNQGAYHTLPDNFLAVNFQAPPLVERLSRLSRGIPAS